MSKPHRTVVRSVFFLAVLVCSSTPLLQASQVRMVNLEQMTERAARIFKGRCTGVSVVRDDALGHEVTVVTFDVTSPIKGVTGDTVTVRMLGAGRGGGASGDAPAGMPAFRKGDEVVLFLYGESSLGLSSPVGLGQGIFKIVSDKQGRSRILNDFRNQKLLEGLRPDIGARLQAREVRANQVESSEPSADLDTATFLAAVEDLVVQQEHGR